MGTRDITAEMRERFARCAPAALRRRSPAYFSAMSMNVLQLIVVSAVGLLGLYVWRWPPMDYVLLLFAACVAGALIDTLRWLLARGELLKQVERHNDDMFVWAIAGALRSGSHRIDPGQLLQYRAGVGVLLDWIGGVLALLAFAFMLRGRWAELAGYVDSNQGLQAALIVTAGLSLAGGLISLWNWRSAGTEGAVLEFGAGGRGLVLLVLAAGMFFTRDSPANFFNLVAILNGITLVLGLFAIFGLAAMRGDTAWLRRHLRETRQAR